MFPKNLANAFMKELNLSEMYSVGSIIRTSQFIGPRTILTGDAAHAVTPTIGIKYFIWENKVWIGIGCNLAIVDAKYVDMALKSEKDLDKALLTYNKLRSYNDKFSIKIDEIYTN